MGTFIFKKETVLIRIPDRNLKFNQAQNVKVVFSIMGILLVRHKSVFLTICRSPVPVSLGEAWYPARHALESASQYATLQHSTVLQNIAHCELHTCKICVLFVLIWIQMTNKITKRYVVIKFLHRLRFDLWWESYVIGLVNFDTSKILNQCFIKLGLFISNGRLMKSPWCLILIISSKVCCGRL